MRPSKFITVAEAAAMLSLSGKTVYNGGAGTRSIRRVRLGSSVRLVRADVEAFVDQKIERARTPDERASEILAERKN